MCMKIKYNNYIEKKCTFKGGLTMLKGFAIDLIILLSLIILIVCMAIGGFVSALLGISLLSLFRAGVILTLALLISESVVSFIRLKNIIKNNITLTYSIDKNSLK